MTLPPLHRLIATTLLLLAGSVALSQQGVPEARFIYSEDTDLPSGDISALFDTTREACERACLADPGCVAFTFNARSNACFPKAAVQSEIPFAGALSARKIATDPALRQAAPARIAALPSLTAADIAAAEELVAANARRHPAGAQTPNDLAAALATALSEGRFANARVLAGFLASLTDSPQAWTALSHASLRLPDALPESDLRQARADAVPAAINGYLRAQDQTQEVGALAQLAEALEESVRGRDMIDPLRRAWRLTGREDLERRLDEAIAKYGFRVTDHQIDSDSAQPRICATFSEPLNARGTDYDTFVRVPDVQLVVSVDGAQLCLDGVEHGQRYEVTLRSGLPA